MRSSGWRGLLADGCLSDPTRSASKQPLHARPPSSSYNLLRNALSENLRVIDTDLSDGIVPESAEMLIVFAPKNLDIRLSLPSINF